MAISLELQEVYASAKGLTYVETLELVHPRYPDPVRWCNSERDWIFLDETGGDEVYFNAYPFRATLPPQSKSGSQELAFTVWNSNTGLERAINEVQEYPNENFEVTYRIYMAREYDPPAIEPPIRMTLTDIVATYETFVLTCTKYDVLGRAFPNEIYKYEEFPGLFR